MPPKHSLHLFTFMTAVYFMYVECFRFILYDIFIVRWTETILGPRLYCAFNCTEDNVFLFDGLTSRSIFCTCLFFIRYFLLCFYFMWLNYLLIVTNSYFLSWIKYTFLCSKEWWDEQNVHLMINYTTVYIGCSDIIDPTFALHWNDLQKHCNFFIFFFPKISIICWNFSIFTTCII